MTWKVTRRQPVDEVTRAMVARWTGDVESMDLGVWFDDVHRRLLAEDGIAWPDVTSFPWQFSVSRLRQEVVLACLADPVDEPAWETAQAVYRADPGRFSPAPSGP